MKLILAWCLIGSAEVRELELALLAAADKSEAQLADAARLRPAWQPMEQWTPKAFESVLLCYLDGGQRIVTEGFHDGYTWMDVANRRARKVQFVAPLPAPPSDPTP